MPERTRDLESLFLERDYLGLVLEDVQELVRLANAVTDPIRSVATEVIELAEHVEDSDTLVMIETISDRTIVALENMVELRRRIIKMADLFAGRTIRVDKEFTGDTDAGEAS